MCRTTWATKVPVLGADVTTLWRRHDGQWASRGDLVIKEHWQDQLKIVIQALAPFWTMNLKLWARARVPGRDINNCSAIPVLLFKVLFQAGCGARRVRAPTGERDSKDCCRGAWCDRV